VTDVSRFQLVLNACGIAFDSGKKHPPKKYFEADSLEENQLRIKGVWHLRCKGWLSNERKNMSKINTLEDVYIDQLRDLYNAETQLIKALPQMAKAAHTKELKRGFEHHLEQTKVHANRLEKIFEEMDKKPSGKTCKAMQGLIEEGAETIGERASPEAKDAALIAAAQRVEHYEMAEYGSVRTYAKILGHSQAAGILQTTLNEESETDKTLTKLAESINLEAAHCGDGHAANHP
jgi:ferritin-like metal-binding protein YciE